MEAVIFCGIQASGKSTYYKKEFFHTHVRISLDVLRTRNREDKFLKTCFDTKQRFVVDNTNPEAKTRIKYIDLAKKAGFKVVCYYFKTELKVAFERNSKRTGNEKIPEKGIAATYKKLEEPSTKEGFDKLVYLHINNEGAFEILKEEE